jgi:hypothetical protein
MAPTAPPWGLFLCNARGHGRSFIFFLWSQIIPCLFLQIIPDAVEDYRSLDGSIKKQVNEKIDKLKENPFLGETLGNKNKRRFQNNRF